jgi:hypothetical protein
MENVGCFLEGAEVKAECITCAVSTNDSPIA